MSSPILLTERACIGCQFVQAEKHPGGGAQLYCRRNPPHPQIVFANTPDGPMPASTLSAWPPVMPEQWCGEFRRKIARADAPAMKFGNALA